MADSGAAVIGEIVNGRYEVLERLGQGTYFQAFKVRDRLQNRMVALKLLKPYWADQPAAVERLATDGNAILDLVHPNISRVYEAGQTDSSAFFATEYVKGLTLKERLKRTAPLPLAVAVDIAIAIAETLEFAHTRGITHGDLRSQNVLITGEGEVKVTDFGVSALLAPTSEDFTPPLRVLQYMAPEVAEGLPPTPSSDIYSLGAILYEMLTGALPFEGDSAIAVALKVAKDPPPTPSGLNAGIPSAVDALLLRCLQKDPSRRYRSIGALLKDLRSAQEALRYGRPLNLPGASGTDTRERNVKVPVEDLEEIEEVPPLASAISTATKVVWAIILLGMIAVGVFAWTYLLKGNPDVRVPQLVGLSRAEAMQKMEGMNLVQHIVEEWKEDLPPGQIYKTYPPAGTAVKPGADLTLWISKGAESVTVPDVTQTSSQSAVDALRELGLVVGTVTDQYDENEKKGTILTQDPPAGQTVKPGTKVNLVKSMGPVPVDEPPAPPDLTDPSDTPITETPTTPTEPTGPPRRFQVQVDVPEGADPQQIQIEVTDDTGANIQYEGSHHPGDSFTRIVTGSGDRVIVRVFSDGQTLSEQVMSRGGSE